MQTIPLVELAGQELLRAQEAPSGRSAKTVIGGHENSLRQTLMALRAGEGLAEHANPGEATLQVLVGRVVLSAGEQSWDGAAGDLLTIPDGLHSLLANEDSVILLTAVKKG